MEMDSLQQFWSFIQDVVTLNNIQELMEEYRDLGPLPGIFLPMLEAILPFLPLFAFVVANAAAFGLWLGFLYSWIGTSLGSIIVFLVIRKLGQKRFFQFLSRNKQVEKLTGWVERHGFGPLFLLICFPFSPSAVINVVAGLSRVSIPQFILAVLSGKMVMVFIISFIGYDIKSLIEQPIRTAIVALIIFILWFAGKRVEIYLNKKERIHGRE
ncbi:putative membrane protein YdjX (TVP38/TMEM64 family) [Bacillus mesophilus]|uniref:TVP38/TMEM64 family membrane protein n=1 Tax=Bacillus mesophilus TaxID=1808955 RepID=A0A6M0Q5H1_9BACI|nr:TVP38/TMEM64 family protein [Bacillus mesophilus]MBM7659841.1 putative membrane protein YdjX (TVP38/TMEM64 family) [Bacillus mesophilus]NEY70700.1 TVP38/TMEM64 family protein [Bacillus mesophilus]